MERWQNRINFQKHDDESAATEEQADAVAENGAKFLAWAAGIVNEVSGQAAAEQLLSDFESYAEAKKTE